MISEENFLAQVVEPRPDPGGGSASAFAGCLAAAITEKICRIQLRTIPDQHLWNDLLNETMALRSNFNDLMELDSRAYLSFDKARKSHASDPKMETFVQQGIDVPLQIIETAHRGLSCVGKAGRACKSHLVSDLQVSCELYGAVISGAYHIARANISLFVTSDKIERNKKHLGREFQKASDRFQETKRGLVCRMETPEDDSAPCGR
jgi:formiminotetrahydrofolate cyclodeaminase